MSAVAPRSAVRWLWLSAAVIALDQASKMLIVARFQEFERLPLLPALLEFTRLHNRGAAFSFLSTASGWQQYLFLALAAVVSIGIVIWLSRLRGPGVVRLAAGLALIAGGALGNAIDRVARGFVVDFIHVHWREVWYFPAFNVADSAITIGAALLILDSLLDARATQTRDSPGVPPGGDA